MKYCTNCGKELNENMKFCTGCGKPCEAQAGETPPAQADPSAAPKNTTININLSSFSKILPTPKGTVLSQNSYLNLLKSFGSGAAFFAFVVLYGLALLVELIGAFSSDLPGMGLIDSLGSPFGISSSDFMDFVPFLDVLDGGMKAVKLIGIIPTALIFAGVLIFYIKSKSTDDSKLPSDGFTFVKISMIIYLVGNALLVAIVLISGIIGAIGMSEGVVFVIGLLASLGFVGAVIYYTIILRLLKALQSGIATGTLAFNFKAITVLIIFNFIVAFKALIFGGNGFFGNLISASAIVAVTVCIIMFKKALETQENVSENQTV